MSSELQSELSCDNSDELHINEISSSSISFDEIQSRIARLTRCQKTVMRYILTIIKTGIIISNFACLLVVEQELEKVISQDR